MFLHAFGIALLFHLCLGAMADPSGEVNIVDDEESCLMTVRALLSMDANGNIYRHRSEFERLEQKLELIDDEFRQRLDRLPESCYAGVRNGDIPDSDITASASCCGSQPTHARLDYTPASWFAGANNQAQWIQIDLESPKKIFGVVTQGRNNYDQWVVTYKVSFGNATTSMQTYRDHGADRVFSGNADRSTKVPNRFNHPITARYFRVLPMTWHGHISMRMELLAC